MGNVAIYWGVKRQEREADRSSSSSSNNNNNNNNNSKALVRERTMPIERPPLVGEVSANLFAVISAFWSGAANFCFKQFHNCTHEAQWTPFQIH
jgi:hypothetical protein